MFSVQPVLPSLSVAAHTTRETRMSPVDLMRFETLLDATDSAVSACMEARALAERRLDEPTPDGYEATAALEATLQAISAATGARCPQASINKGELVQWTIKSILSMRETAVRDATRHNLAPGVDPKHVAKCMDLISALHERLGAH